MLSYTMCSENMFSENLFFDIFIFPSYQVYYEVLEAKILSLECRALVYYHSIKDILRIIYVIQLERQKTITL